MSWALSCLQFKRYYDEVELVTDKAGKALLIDRLELPYTKVHVRLDELNHYSVNLWALGKLYAYRMQTEPFIHADGDVYIWGRLPNELEKAPLLAQNRDENYSYYHEVWNDARQHLPYLADVLTQSQSFNQGHILASNAGIIGGNNIDFIQQYCAQAFDMVERNKNHLHLLVGPGLFNIVYEQFLFHALAQAHQLPVAYLLNDVEENAEQLVNFRDVPYRSRYIHPVQNYKRNAAVGESMARCLRREHPQAYFRINQLVNNFLL